MTTQPLSPLTMLLSHHTRRRDFITLLGGAAAWPIAARAQQAGKVPRIGYMVMGSLQSPDTHTFRDAFRHGLRERGYVEGQNVTIEYRAADGELARFPELARELVRLNPDLIFAPNTPAARAAKQATTTIPIVAPIMGDPVSDGLVASLARPGGNITGMTFLGPELAAKRLELLKQAVPAVSRVAALWDPGAYSEATMREMIRNVEAASAVLQVQLKLLGVREPAEFERAFVMMATERSDALILLPSPMLFGERRQLIDLATAHRLPSIAMAREFVELGGLLAYGASISDLVRRAGSYVDKILRGAKPADLPVEQPTKFELFINLRTAKALGIEVPAKLLALADEVIE
jgi:putative tryptophan/tyrosine transport system substrate-binding protein